MDFNSYYCSLLVCCYVAKTMISALEVTGCPWGPPGDGLGLTAHLHSLTGEDFRAGIDVLR